MNIKKKNFFRKTNKMNYDSKHVEVKSPKDWYNLIADEYWKHHNHLNSFDKWFFLKILPRNLENIDVLDIWAWDWRVWKYFKDKPIGKYTACDISEKLLKRHPWTKKIEKIICDLEESLPFKDDIYDLALSFFVLEHIENIENLFKEIYRVLKPGGQRIIWHFLQRREFIWKKNKDKFKIRLFNYRIQDLEEIAKDSFFSIDVFPIIEKSTTIGFVISLKKD